MINISPELHACHFTLHLSLAVAPVPLSHSQSSQIQVLGVRRHEQLRLTAMQLIMKQHRQVL